jgi:hypothetical protein
MGSDSCSPSRGIGFRKASPNDEWSFLNGSIVPSMEALFPLLELNGDVVGFECTLIDFPYELGISSG